MDAAFIHAYGFLSPLGILAAPILALVLAWTIAIKGVALWKSARNSHKAWFIVLLIVNTLGILELIYIFAVAKRSAPAAPSSTPVA